MTDDDEVKRPFIRAYWVSASEAGGCNFCTDRHCLEVLQIGSNHPMRNLSVRFCGDCLTELKKVVLTKGDKHG